MIPVFAAAISFLVLETKIRALSIKPVRTFRSLSFLWCIYSYYLYHFYGVGLYIVIICIAAVTITRRLVLQTLASMHLGDVYLVNM